jgi:hypothetical protein
VIEVTVRGINEHTRHLMVTWPDGTKSDDDEVGSYNTYFSMDTPNEEILAQRKMIDDAEKWLETHAIDVVSKAKKAVADALGDEQ